MSLSITGPTANQTQSPSPLKEYNTYSIIIIIIIKNNTNCNLTTLFFIMIIITINMTIITTIIIVFIFRMIWFRLTEAHGDYENTQQSEAQNDNAGWL